MRLSRYFSRLTDSIEWHLLAVFWSKRHLKDVLTIQLINLSMLMHPALDNCASS